jgi:hypothetical protein
MIKFTMEEPNPSGFPKISKITAGPRPQKVIVNVADSEEEATIINWDI